MDFTYVCHVCICVIWCVCELYLDVWCPGGGVSPAHLPHEEQRNQVLHTTQDTRHQAKSVKGRCALDQRCIGPSLHVSTVSTSRERVQFPSLFFVTSSLATAPKTPLTPLDSPESLRIVWRLSSRLDGTLNTRSCTTGEGGEGVGTGQAERGFELYMCCGGWCGCMCVCALSGTATSTQALPTSFTRTHSTIPNQRVST